jgi:hypothetical protein
MGDVGAQRERGVTGGHPHLRRDQRQ